MTIVTTEHKKQLIDDYIGGHVEPLAVFDAPNGTHIGIIEALEVDVYATRLVFIALPIHGVASVHVSKVEDTGTRKNIRQYAKRIDLSLFEQKKAEWSDIID